MPFNWYKAVVWYYGTLPGTLDIYMTVTAEDADTKEIRNHTVFLGTYEDVQGIGPCAESINVCTINQFSADYNIPYFTSTGGPFFITPSVTVPPFNNQPRGDGTTQWEFPTNYPPPEILTNALYDFKEGHTETGEFIRCAGGTPPLNWNITTDPPQGWLTWIVDPNDEHRTLYDNATPPQGSGGTSFNVMATVTDNDGRSGSTPSPGLLAHIAYPLTATFGPEQQPHPVVGQYYENPVTLQHSGGVAPINVGPRGATIIPGLSIEATEAYPTGCLVGTPTQAGTWNLYVTVTDFKGNQVSGYVTVVVDPAPTPPLEITTTSLPAGTVGQAYSAQLNAQGGTPPYSWSITAGSLPPGLSLSSDGVISGTPTQEGSFTFTVTVQDSAQPPNQASRQFTITINPAPPPQPLEITTTSLPKCVEGQSYNTTLSAQGGVQPYTWALINGTLPAGLSLSSNGIISGTPTQSGSFAFEIQVRDSQQNTASKAFALSVIPKLVVETKTLPPAVVNKPYSKPLSAQGGVTPYSWSLVSGTLPAGLSLSSNGTISGTPTQTGTFTFTVRCTDSTDPQTADQTLTLTVEETLATANEIILGWREKTMREIITDVSLGTTPYVRAWTVTLDPNSMTTITVDNRPNITILRTVVISPAGICRLSVIADGFYTGRATVLDAQLEQSTPPAALAFTVNTAAERFFIQLTNTGGTQTTFVVSVMGETVSRNVAEEIGAEAQTRAR
jgi:hypothetical protein